MQNDALMSSSKWAAFLQNGYMETIAHVLFLTNYLGQARNDLGKGDFYKMVETDLKMSRRAVDKLLGAANAIRDDAKRLADAK